VTTRIVVLLALAAGCSKSSKTEPATRWIELTPMAVKLEAPAYATVGQTQESLDTNAPPGMIVSARECVLVVTPGSRGDLAKQEADVTASHPGATITKREPPAADGAGLYLGYEYDAAVGGKARSFRFETTIDETTYRCEPFTGRADVRCEEAACRSLRAK